MFIIVKYINKVPSNKIVNGIYTEKNNMSIDLSQIILTNPTTYSNILLLLVLFIVLFVITVIRKRQQKSTSLSIILIGLLLVPLTTHALGKFTIKAETTVTIEEHRNMIEARYADGESNPNGIIDREKDFWKYTGYIKTITFKKSIEEPTEYVYKFDVSEEKNNSIIAYLLRNEQDNYKYDLHIMSNGYIYANYDSRYMFYRIYQMTDISNMEYLKTVYTTDMSYMFYKYGSLKSINLGNFSNEKLTNVNHMFFECIGLTEINFTKFNTSNVTDMSDLFHSCFELKEIDLSGFDTSNVTNMYGMFSGCINLTTIDLSNFDTSNVTNMGSMFSNCGLTNIDLSNFDTSNVTNMSSMFSNCGLTNIDISNLDTSNVTSMYDMFRGCINLTTLDLSSFNTSNVTNMSYMFYDDRNLETIYVGNEWDVSNVNISDYMFNNCVKLPNFSSSSTSKAKAHTNEVGYLILKS